MLHINEYYKQYDIFHPVFNVSRIVGQQIRFWAFKYFSDRVLDIGCGSKTKILLVREFVEAYFGLDQLESLHDQSNVDIYGTAYSIPVGSDCIDCVICTAVLELLEEPRLAIRETFRILKPGG